MTHNFRRLNAFPDQRFVKYLKSAHQLKIMAWHIILCARAEHKLMHAYFLCSTAVTNEYL